MRVLALLALLSPLLVFAQNSVLLLALTPPESAFYGQCDTVSDQLDSLYFNSCETGAGAGGNSVNSNWLMADDFEDGRWAYTDDDCYRNGSENSECVSDGGSHAFERTDDVDNDGWNMQIYFSGTHDYPDHASDYVECSGAGFGNTDCAATSGYGTGTSKAMGSHGFVTEGTELTEIYVRFYVKPLSGYDTGHEKTWGTVSELYPSSTDAPIPFGLPSHEFGDLKIRFQCTSWGAEPDPADDNANCNCPADCSTGLNIAGDDYLEHNITSCPLTVGRWNFVEWHMKLNSAYDQYDGVWELWTNDCGVDDSSCAGTATLCSQHTDVRYITDSGANIYDGMTSIFFENWSNPASDGEKYYDQLVVSKTGPIGFCDECLD